MRSFQGAPVIVVVAVCLARVAAAADRGRNRYGFYRAMGASGGRQGEASGRRVFGGQAAAQNAWPAACVLLDRYKTPHCSGSVVAENWALTAAHCISPNVAYVKYNTQQPSLVGETSPVLVLYRHPGFRVIQQDLGRGMDVTLLHHDVGLVRTRNPMRLQTKPALNPIHAMTKYSLRDITGVDVQVLGFGRTEGARLGEELVEVQLRVTSCDRYSWLHCVCGTAPPGERSAGVCSGDSGGPVVYRGAQFAVTSMGPIECYEGANLDTTANSVFTALYEYAPIVNATILETENAIRMSRMSTNAGGHLAASPALAALLSAAAALTAHTIIK